MWHIKLPGQEGYFQKKQICSPPNNIDCQIYLFRMSTKSKWEPIVMSVLKLLAGTKDSVAWERRVVEITLNFAMLYTFGQRN